MKRLAVILASFALLAGAAGAADHGASLENRNGQGFASVVTSGSTITYAILVDGIGQPTGAELVVDGVVLVDLQAVFSDGNAVGTRTGVPTSDVSTVDGGGAVLRVNGTSGVAEGSLANLGGSQNQNQAGVFEIAGVDPVVENDPSVTLTVLRAGGSDGAVSVDYATQNGTAVAGVDYVQTTGTLTWADGDADPKTFAVPLIDDADEDGNKTFTVVISGATGGADVGSAQTTVSVLDDEALVCAEDDDTLCLNVDGRFKAELSYVTPDESGRGRTIPVGRDSGLFYFFGEDNAEMLIKVLDACSFADHFWVFYAATTNVQFTLTVTDTRTGAQKVYTNPQGAAAVPVQDTAAFATCP